MVQHALAGINPPVVALIAVSVLKLGKTNLRGRPAVCIFLGVLVLGELSGLLAVDPATPLGAVLDLLSILHSLWWQPERQAGCWAG